MKHTGIKCKSCGDEIYSMYRHDFKRCECGKCFIDGGFDYTRIGGSKDNFKYIYKEVSDEDRKASDDYNARAMF